MERELHFGPVAKDSRPPRRSVRLLGPPLARACTVHASEGWIRIEETTDGIHVCVDTSRVGKRRGDITITGPTDKAVIPVSVEITPKQQPPPPACPSPITTAEPSTASAPPPAAPPRPLAASLGRLRGTVTTAQPPDDAGRKPAPPSTDTERVSELDRLRRWCPRSHHTRIPTAVVLLLRELCVARSRSSGDR